MFATLLVFRAFLHFWGGVCLVILGDVIYHRIQKKVSKNCWVKNAWFKGYYAMEIYLYSYC